MKKNYKIAFQGIAGAYSYEALLKLGEENNLKIEPKESSNFVELFDNIEKLGLGFAPIENSNAGAVSLVLDLLFEREVEIVAEYYFTVNHTLLVRKNSSFENIKKVYSHSQALAQCSDFLNKNHLQAVSFGDTAGSAKYLQEKGDTDEAVIGSEKLADLYDLKIVKRNIQNSRDNVTRFFLLKKKGFNFNEKVNGNTGKHKTSLLFCTRNIPGALYKALGGFATNGVNLTKIESRPTRKKGFTYFFYIDFDGQPKDTLVKNALDELNFFSDKIKILGSYYEAKRPLS